MWHKLSWNPPRVILECHLCLAKSCWVKESIWTLYGLYQRNKKHTLNKTRTKIPIEFCHATTDSPHSTMAQLCMPRCLVFDSSITLRSLRGFKKLGKVFSTFGLCCAVGICSLSYDYPPWNELSKFALLEQHSPLWLRGKLPKSLSGRRSSLWWGHIGHFSIKLGIENFTTTYFLYHHWLMIPQILIHPLLSYFF